MNSVIISCERVQEILSNYISDSGKTRQQFAFEMGYSGAYVSNMINGKRRVPEKVLKLLGIQAQLFIRYSIDPDADL